MSANTYSYFVFQLAHPENPQPAPKPEWPPVELPPTPPTTDPVPTVPPVTAGLFAFHSYMLN